MENQANQVHCMLRRELLYRSAVAVLAGAITNPSEDARAVTTNPRRKLRVGMIGTGHSHAAGKLSALRDLHDDFEIVGVAEPHARLRRAIEAEVDDYQIPWVTEAELLSPQLDAVVVETAVQDLVPTAQRCVDANKHVHLEKPGCESRRAFVQLFNSAGQSGRHIQMGYMLRHNPAFQACFRAVREGWLGRVFEVTGSMSKLVEDTRRPEFAEYRGGAMFELGCHIIDAMVTILGPPHKVTPFNCATRNDGVLDNQLAVFKYADTIATIRSSIVEPHGGDRRHFEVSGENGTIAIRPIEPPALHIALQRPAGNFQAGSQTVEVPASPGRYHEQLQEFASVIRGEKQLRWAAEHDLAVHLAVLQASGLPIDS